MSFGLLIAFIHHVTMFLQASRIIDEVSTEIEHCCKEIYPLNALPEDAKFSTTAGEIPTIDQPSREIFSSKSGYLQTINLGNILTLAEKNNAIVRYHFRPGEFIIKGDLLATTWCDEGQWGDIQEDINSSISTGCERTEMQDIEYAFDQLVEVALRAMSKGINDPFTAISCVHRLTSALSLIATETLPSGLIHDESGQLRIAAITYDYSGITDAAFHQMRQHAKEIESVSIEMMKSLVKLSKREAPEGFHSSILLHADLLLEDCQTTFKNKHDFEEIKSCYDGIRKDSQ